MYGIHEVIKNDSLSLGSWVGYVPITSNKELKKIWIVEEKRTEAQFLQEGSDLTICSSPLLANYSQRNST